MRIGNEINSKLGYLPMESMMFHKDREVDIYITENKDRDWDRIENTTPRNSQLEVVVFNYDLGLSQIFLRLPGSDLYLECNGGTGRSGGGKTLSHIHHIIQEWQLPLIIDGGVAKVELELYTSHSTEGKALLVDSLDHWFLKHVAHKNRPEFSKLEYPHLPAEFGQKHINTMLNSHFVCLPQWRRITFALKSFNGDYLIMDHSIARSTKLEDRCWYGKKGKMQLIKPEHYAVYRDGGTTTFDFIYEEEKYDFFYPSRMFKSNFTPATITKKLSGGLEQKEHFGDLNGEEIKDFVEELDILLEPKYYKQR